MAKTILIVDDSNTMRSLLELSLKSLGDLKVITAKNGAEALDKMAAVQPALVLVDVNMPVMGGLEFIEQVRSVRNDKSTPIVIITTQGDEEHVRKGLSLGATAYLTKPVNGARLVETALKLLGRG
jgi:two-component system chemotaxis response regulator CheY